MSKEFEIHGCIEVPINLSENKFWDKFIGFVEENNWSFGGGINEIIDGFYINNDGTKGNCVLDNLPQNLHDSLTDELFQHHSLAALIFLINVGRELEFSINNEKCFISKSRSSKTVSLWVHEDEQSFDSIEALIETSVICNQQFLHIFHKTTLETLF